MKADELIAGLPQDSMAQKSPMTLATLSIFLTALTCLITKFWLGLRPELSAMMITASFCYKTLILSSLTILSWQALHAPSTLFGRFTLKHCGICLAVFFLASLAYEWLMKPASQIGQLFLLPYFKQCLMYVTLYGSGITVIMLAFIKRAAPSHYERTAGFIGLTSACMASLGYSVHCPIDSPTFILIAYGVPQVGLYVVSQLLFMRFLHW